jgi:hypothetical protein
MTNQLSTRLTNAFSKKLGNRLAVTAVGYFAYNFIKIHCTFRVTPAMATGITDRLWDIEDLVAASEASEWRAKDGRSKRLGGSAVQNLLRRNSTTT